MAFCESGGRNRPGWIRVGRGGGPARTGPRIMWPCEATRSSESVHEAPIHEAPVHEVFDMFDAFEEGEDPFLE